LKRQRGDLRQNFKKSNRQRRAVWQARVDKNAEEINFLQEQQASNAALVAQHMFYKVTAEKSKTRQMLREQQRREDQYHQHQQELAELKAELKLKTLLKSRSIFQY
jgi:hypothetical protein